MIRGLWMVSPNAAICSAFDERFADLPGFRSIRGRFEDIESVDAFVTAGNSYGLMSAGIDAAVVARFGEAIQDRVQQRVLDDYLGEQPVGTAFLVPTDNPTIPHLVYAPTMRVPGNIEGTDKVYSATWAALLAVAAHNRRANRPIEVVAFPAMGTGFGGVPAAEAARQMAAAYRHLLEPPHRLDWDFVASRQKSIFYDESRQVAR